MQLEFAFSYMVNASPPHPPLHETFVLRLSNFLTWRYSVSPCDIWRMLAFKATSFIILIGFFLPRVAVGCKRFGRNFLPRKC